MSLGLLIRASSGWQRVLGIAKKVVVWMAPCVRVIAVRVRVAAGVLASENGSCLKAGLVQNRHFRALVRVRALGRSKTAHL